MEIVKNIPKIVEIAKERENYLAHNKCLLNIYEGDLLQYIEKDLRLTMSPRAFTQAMSRVAPINILIKIIDKLSKIYQQRLTRYVADGVEEDSSLLSWYEKKLQINNKMNISNEYFNLFKTSLIYPFLNKGQPALRIIPGDRFFVISDDLVDPMNPTCVVLVMREEKDYKNGVTTIYQAFTDQEQVFFNSKGEILFDEMAKMNNPEGINPIGKIPFVYVNKSTNRLMPIQDSDTIKMTKLIPIILTDLNYAVMYQAFSIVYGINLDASQMEKNPDTIWFLKSDDPEKKPEIGVLKPEVDISETLNLIQSQLSMWLNSKGIRPGSIGTLTQDSFASGISKMIDEMDTSEDRKEQVGYFVDAEAKLWDLIMHNMHPYWVSQGLIENSYLFTSTASVITEFIEQRPMAQRKDLIEEVYREYSLGFMTLKDAIIRLNPEFSETKALEYLNEIQKERTIEIDASTLQQNIDQSDSVDYPKQPSDLEDELSLS